MESQRCNSPAPHQRKNIGAPLVVVNAKVSRAEAAALARAAEAAGVTRSGLLRRLLAEALERTPRSPEVGLVTTPDTSASGSARVNVEAVQAA